MVDKNGLDRLHNAVYHTTINRTSSMKPLRRK